MNRKLAISLAAGALVFGVPRSEATQITGTVGFTGSFSGAPLNLANATSISFVNPKVQTVEAGSILDLYIDVGDSASIASPLNVAGVAPTALPLPSSGLGAGVIYTVDGFTLTLTSLTLSSESAKNLILDGVGTLSGHGYQTTPGDINIAFSRSGNTLPGASFTFAATSSANPSTTRKAPDGGTTAMLLGVGLLGVAGLRRKLA